MFYRAYFCVVLSLLVALPVLAVEPKTGDGGLAMKKAQGLIRQLSQDKTALESEKAAWQAEKSAQQQEKFTLEAKLQLLLAEVGKLQPLVAEVERYKAGLENLKTGYDKQLQQERQNQQTLVQKYNAMISKANAIFADNQLLVQAVRERETWIAQCSAGNEKLRTALTELADKYRGKSLFQQLGELEPLTGLGKIEAETTLEEYHYQLKHLQMIPFKPSVAGFETKTEAAEPPAANLSNQENAAAESQTENQEKAAVSLAPSP